MADMTTPTRTLNYTGAWLVVGGRPGPLPGYAALLLPAWGIAAEVSFTGRQIKLTYAIGRAWLAAGGCVRG